MNRLNPAGISCSEPRLHAAWVTRARLGLKQTRMSELAHLYAGGNGPVEKEKKIATGERKLKDVNEQLREDDEAEGLDLYSSSDKLSSVHGEKAGCMETGGDVADTGSPFRLFLSFSGLEKRS